MRLIYDYLYKQQAPWVGTTALFNILSLVSNTVLDTKQMCINIYWINERQPPKMLKEIMKSCLWMPGHTHGLMNRGVRDDSSNSELTQL